MNEVPPLPDRFARVEPLSLSPFERSFAAFDRLLQRDVVLRLPAVSAWAGWSAPVRERLLREARALAKVQHPGLLPIVWVEETDQGPLLVQLPPEGEPLADRLRHAVLTIDEALSLGIGVAGALGAMHYAGVVHRGIGVDAVWLLPDGSVRLGAFTFAKAFTPHLPSSIDHNRRQDSVVAGQLPPYPAPEQLAGRGADPRADVFALGCLLWRCLVGADPNAAEQGGEAGDVRKARADTPRALAAVLRCCMQMAPTARYPTAQAVADALAAVRSGKSTGGGPSRRTLAAAGVGLAALGALGLWRPWSAADAMRTDRWSDAPATAGALYSDRYDAGHALLIGIGDGYDDQTFPRLAGPQREIAAVRDRLLAIDPMWRRPDAIQLLRDPTARQIAEALERLKGRPGAEDAVFVYFAGHGVRKDWDKRYWLVGADARSSEPGFGVDGFVEGAYLTNLELCAAKHVFVVLDCCFAAQLVPPDTVRGRPAGGGDIGDGNRSPRLQRRVRQYLFSANQRTSARDAGPDGISKFCRAFLDALDPALGPRQVTPLQLCAAIERAMPPEQQPVLQPQTCDAEGSSFVFFVPPPPK